MDVLHWDQVIKNLGELLGILVSPDFLQLEQYIQQLTASHVYNSET
jgi:hypothetical protein